MLVLASLGVAVMAAFTSLRLTSNLRQFSAPRRKARVVQAAFALGSGIWSMHFVGMLAVELPVTIAYHPLPTLISALIAVLVTGAALLSLHFGQRSRRRIVIAGTVTGLGIVSMHYAGMSAISANCIVTYSPVGVAVAVGLGIAASIAAMSLAYGTRSLAATISGSVVLGLAISAMHYSAMYFTMFNVAAGVTAIPTPYLSTGPSGPAGGPVFFRDLRAVPTVRGSGRRGRRAGRGGRHCGCTNGPAGRHRNISPNCQEPPP